MGVNTIKRSGKGKPLTHEEFDTNWVLIEDAINSRARKELYEIANSLVDIEYSDTGDVAAIMFKYNIVVKEEVRVMPILKCWATVNGVIRAVGGSTDLVEGNDFPVAANTELTGLLEITVPVNGEVSPAFVKVYISDDAGNFCNTQEGTYNLIPR